MAALLAFAQRGLLDPLALHAYLNLVQVPVDIVVPRTVRGRPVPPPVAAQMRKADDKNRVSARARGGDSEEESEADRKARLRIGTLGALQWVLNACAQRRKLPENLLEILSDAQLWSSLCHEQTCPFAEGETFGYGQPGVRSYASRATTRELARYSDETAGLVPLLSVAVLCSSFAEPSVQGTLWLMLCGPDYGSRFVEGCIQQQPDISLKPEELQTPANDSDHIFRSRWPAPTKRLRPNVVRYSTGTLTGTALDT
ncbi:hypothetical protein EDB85DRAFT_2287642 [Lactarius pseudohatsudake]|nr:hypothetical protein EDB85DRAFT_2287642 [Lactarius pseudohatsudake]